MATSDVCPRPCKHAGTGLTSEDACSSFPSLDRSVLLIAIPASIRLGPPALASWLTLQGSPAQIQEGDKMTGQMVGALR